MTDETNEIIIGIDLETTGTDINKDRIIQIALFKVALPDFNVLSKFTALINPGRPIPEKAIEVHGITDVIVSKSKSFKEILPEIFSFINSYKVFFGHNINTFDIPLLVNEINRTNPDNKSEASDFICIDTLAFWNAQENRSLSSAYFRFCGKILEGAHDASADLLGNCEVLIKMVETFGISSDIDGLVRACVSEAYVAGTYHFQWGKLGEVDICFGKHSGKAFKHVLVSDKQYFEWLVHKSDFPLEVKEFVYKCMTEGVPVHEGK